MAKIIAHIDLNAFYVRCEEILDPSLINKPVAIGHIGRGGIVSTCSYEARKYGVCSGQPMFQATKLCPDLIIKEGSYKFYNVMSREFRLFISSICPKMEMFSCDECYCDFTDILKDEKDPISFFKKIQNDLFKRTGLYCSIGVSTTKFLAKMGSDMKKPNGLTIIRKKDIDSMLFPLKIESMFGIGKKTSPRLKKIGVLTIGDLYERLQKKDIEVLDILGKGADIIEMSLKGEGSDEIIPFSNDQKSLGHATTLSKDTDDQYEIKAAIKWLSIRVSQDLKRVNKLGTTVQLVLKDSLFNTMNKSKTVPQPINSSEEIEKIALSLYNKNYLGLKIRLVGVTLQHLVNSKNMVVQMTFVDHEKYEEESKTKLLINELNRKCHMKVLKRASEVKDGDK